MTVARSTHEALGAVFEGDRPVHYGRPERTHRAVRNVAGVTEMAHGVVVLEGDDRVEYLDNAVSNRVPAAEGEGCYALLLDPQGRIRADLYAYNAGERLLVFTDRSMADELAEEWAETVFIQDVDIREATDEFCVLGVHGPKATEKVASVLNGTGTPADRLSFVRGRIADAGVTVVRGDGLAGEPGYEVVCGAGDAEAVFDALVHRGLNATPFGTRTWGTLTLEAGTPLFESELQGNIPNELGIRNALDFEKGCYVGQEVVSRVENRGRPGRRLLGLRPESAPGSGATIPESGAAVFAGDAAVGEVTRAVESPTLEAPVALALVGTDTALDALAGDADLTVRVDGGEVPAEAVELPFVDGSERSARLPEYP